MLRSRLSLLGAAVLFSTGGAVIKSCGLSAWQVASFRAAVAMIAVLLLLRSARRAWSAPTIFTAFAYAATMVLFVSANKLTTAANTIFLQSTAPLYMLFFGPWLLREPLRVRDFGFLAAFGAGLAMFAADVNAPLASAPDPELGNLLAALSGLSWALTIGGLRWIGKRAVEPSGASAALVAGNAITFLACLPLALPVESAKPIDWVLVVYLGAVQVGLAYVLLGYGLRRVSGLEASFLLLLEPVLNPIWAWLVHGELPGERALLGGAVILGATATRTWIESRTVTVQRAS